MNTLQNEIVSISLHVNGADRSLTIEPRVSLLDALRDHLCIPGTKKGCNQGACGACTVLVDGERINSCLALAVQYQGRKIMQHQVKSLLHQFSKWKLYAGADSKKTPPCLGLIEFSLNHTGTVISLSSGQIICRSISKRPTSTAMAGQSFIMASAVLFMRHTARSPLIDEEPGALRRLKSR